MESVLQNMPWNFDIHLLVLDRVSGEELPSKLNMHYRVFWVRIYDLPLMMRLKMMAKKIEKIIGDF